MQSTVQSTPRLVAAPAMPQPATKLAVQLEDITFYWPGQEQPTLRIASFALAQGETLFLSGPSGGGKSTLISLIAGILQPATGSVHVNGMRMDTLPRAARDALRGDFIGIIFQQFNLIPHLSMLNNVLLPCRFSALRARRAADRDGSPEQSARRLLESLGLARELWGQNVARLSVGQQQRVAAARALVGAPPLIMADEPTSALDADRRADFLHLLLRQCAEAGSSLLFVSHDSTLADAFARRESMVPINRPHGGEQS
ncbi:ATP-binding cassette domain-containing protein [Desulfovibrio sp.]|uniref:ATP-binding cassette domain-containing protein n=1 Tax=Desulfovibrio sp. TaxID=885 RepID=UPI0025BE8894|nr:ATP-binding cassette domain-containing protein [Desulfovibrio sp.]